jgi:hypothetical protein
MQFVNATKELKEIVVYAVEKHGNNAQVLTALPEFVLQEGAGYVIFGFAWSRNKVPLVLFEEQVSDGRAYATCVTDWELIFGPFDRENIERMVQLGMLKRV